MAKILDEKYNVYLKEAERKINPEMIPDDDGTAYWDFLCLFQDCINHEFSRYWRVNGVPESNETSEDEELRLAAECEVICRVLARKPRFCFV